MATRRLCWLKKRWPVAGALPAMLRRQKASCEQIDHKKSVLYKCEPVSWANVPRPVRTALAYITVCLFSLCFLAVPILLLLLADLATFQLVPLSVSLSFIVCVAISLILPVREWPAARLVGQLWYELFDFHCNVSEEERHHFISEGDTAQFIIGMHPHGIIPLQAILWTAYCEQYLSHGDRALYGFGAAADVTQYLPFLRNVMGWLSAGGAQYSTLLAGLVEGKSVPVNRNGGRRPRNLYILPGGVAEVFVSTPGQHTIVFKHRRGLTRLSLETGAKLMPCYVFGGTDFYNNFATADNPLARLSRRLQMGLTLFWGPWSFLMPFVPYTPKVTMVIAPPLEVEKWDMAQGPIPAEKIESLHEQYVNSIRGLFEQYKAVAGYPDAVLKVV